MKLARTVSKLPDRYLLTSLIVVSAVLRLPFLRSFSMVSYDGTYYINLARSVMDGTAIGGPFPLGYPFHIVPFMMLLDDVRAAQVASFVAAMGTLIVLYYLCKQWVPRGLAFAGAVVLAVSPLFIHFSMTTMSESVYIFWLLLGLLFYARGRLVFAGATLGLATITRPEALPLFIILALLRLRERRGLLLMTASFAVVYLVNTLAFSLSSGQFVLVQKANNFALGAKDWKELEHFFGRGAVNAEVEQENIIAYYFKRLPFDLWLFVRHTVVVLIPLAIIGFAKRRLFLAIAVLPFLVFSLFTPRSEARFVLPYVPIVIVFAMIAIASLKKSRQRVALGVVLAAAAAGLVFNIGLLTTPLNAEFASSRETGAWLSSRVARSDRVADRKPFVAFYAEATFEKIPAAAYNETIEHLVEHNVRILSLHHPTTSVLRPALRSLLYDAAVINGEMRFRQLYSQNTGEVIYESTGQPDPLQWNLLPMNGDLVPMTPSWAPNGQSIAYRVKIGADAGEIRVLSARDGQSITVHRGRAPKDPIAWSPDSKRIVFSESVGGRASLQILDLDTGTIDVITDAGGDDVSPSWSPDGREIAFSSNRTGQSEIYALHVETRAIGQLTVTGGNRFPSIAPDNQRVAWIRDGGGVLIADRRTGETVQAVAPTVASNAPTWSADASFLAVEGKIWGGANIFLVRADGGDALLLTKQADGQVMPDWSPDGRRLAIISRQGDRVGLCLLGGLEPYMQRLIDPGRIYTFKPLAE